MDGLGFAGPPWVNPSRVIRTVIFLARVAWQHTEQRELARVLPSD